MLNGIAFYVLLFATDQWRRVVPLTWEVFPNALSTAIQYASLDFPVDQVWTRYNGLQQLSYLITVFIAANLRALNVTPHVVQNDSITATGKRRQSAIDGRTTRHKGYGLSQSCRAMIECIFGWGKQHGTMRKTKHRGITKVTTDFMLNLIAYNLIHIPKLLTA